MSALLASLTAAVLFGKASATGVFGAPGVVARRNVGPVSRDFDRRKSAGAHFSSLDDGYRQLSALDVPSTRARSS